jgi:hypothetical protein
MNNTPKKELTEKFTKINAQKLMPKRLAQFKFDLKLS